MAEDGAVRRLAAVLATDVAGYSRLMRADETGTLARLKRHHEELIRPTINQHRGRIVKLMGDGALVEFVSATDSVRCAISIQRAMADRSASMPEAKRIALRIGINLGDIIVEGDDIYGDGVNVAARMETLAQPGGICISAKVFDEVRRDSELGFADLGEQWVKNIPDPIRAYHVLLDPSQAGTIVDARGEPPSLAVLPFKNLSRDYFLSYLSDGFAEDLINAFARLRDLPVIARESSFAQRGRLEQEQDVARALEVTHVLGGSVRRTERRLEIDAWLIDGGSGARVWSEYFDRPAHDVLPIRDQIVASVATVLNRPLSEAEREGLARGVGAKPEAYDLLQRAREMRASASRAMARQAIRTLDEAVALDPEFSLGWSELGVTIDLAARAGWIDTPEDRERALDAAERAIALDPSLGEAHSVLGAALLARGDLRGIHALEEGVAACPNAAWPAAMLGRHLPDQGRPAEGLQMVQRAFRLNPVAPGWYFEARGWARFALREHDQAVADFDEAARLAPEDLRPRLGLVVGYAAAGRLDAARVMAQEVLRIAPGLTADSARAEITDPVSRERQVAMLRLAGVPGGAPELASPPLSGEGLDTNALLTYHFETMGANMPPNLDPDALADRFAEDCINVQPLRELPGGPFHGRDAMRRFYATFDAHWASWKHVERRRVVQGNVAVWEGLVQGTHKKTGKFVSMPIVFFLEFNADGKVQEEYVYVDNGLVEEQIR